MPTRRRLLIFLAAASLFPSLARAGDLNNWRTIAAPAGGTLVSAPNSIGTTIAYLTTTDAHFYSGITKEWTVVPVSNPGFFEQYNAYIVLQDGNQLHGFATRQGVVDTLTVSPSAQIVSGPVSSSWVTLVSDGLNAWGFSAFLGEWVPLPVTLSQPNPALSSRRYCGLLQDGNTVWGFSAYHGTFVSIAADSQAVILADEETGVAHSPGVFRAFSVHQNNWASATVSTANAYLDVGYASTYDGNTITAFSGLTGTLNQTTAAAPVVQNAQTEMTSAWVAGSQLIAYAAGQGTFDTMAAANPAVFGDYEYLLVQEGNALTPFSSVTGGFGAAITGTYIIETNDAVAYANGATADYAYSPILNQWIAAPTITQTASPTLVRSAVCLTDASGYYALSARHGTWVPISVTGGALTAPSNGSTLLVFHGASSASVFDSRLNRWATMDGSGTLLLQISRHTVLGYDSTNAWAFGQPTGRWDSTPLQSPVAVSDVSSSSGFVTTATDLHTYCVQGSFSYDGRFPEFSRAMKLGNDLRLHQVGPAGSALILFIGNAPAHISAGPLFGTLYVDPAGMITMPLPVTIPPSGLLHLTIALPISPALVGLQPHLQNAVIPPSAPPYLSTSVAPILY